MSMLLFLDILDSNNFKDHIKQPMIIHEPTVTIKIQIPLVFPPSAHAQCQVFMRASEVVLHLHRVKSCVSGCSCCFTIFL